MCEHTLNYVNSLRRLLPLTTLTCVLTGPFTSLQTMYSQISCTSQDMWFRVMTANTRTARYDNNLTGPALEELNDVGLTHTSSLVHALLNHLMLVSVPFDRTMTLRTGSFSTATATRSLPLDCLFTQNILWGFTDIHFLCDFLPKASLAR